jgi:hypothetical protein
MAKKITPGEHNMQMAKKAGNALLRAAIGPIGETAVKAVTGGAYDVLTRSDNQKNASMVEKANNDKSVTENYSMTKASYGLPRDQWRNKSINPQESLKVELKARERGYVPPSERSKKETIKQDIRPRGRVETPAQEREMMFKALKKSDGPREVDPVKSRMDLKK